MMTNKIRGPFPDYDPEQGKVPQDYITFACTILLIAVVIVAIFVEIIVRAKADNIETKAAMMRGEAFEYIWRHRFARDPNDGVASHYNDRYTASGERLRPYDTVKLTCAHPDPRELGQMLRIRRGDRCIVCRVNDIGPAEHLHRAIDLTPAGFKLLGMRPIDGLGGVRIDRKETCHG